ncbi:cupin domain-containing protein [Nakamurella sp. YIM 132087]|uniref:Cupin domain-containing protein n=1 Tax=Nakamurella alba TaxID=2665158 RepID=A0A7K1FEL4_9ACTN|nr:helix-turn-helix domain-containing protein [Nakamurella alba]MTD12538.1 cupin domain-containing protein [Nakamurella alba]
MNPYPSSDGSGQDEYDRAQASTPHVTTRIGRTIRRIRTERGLTLQDVSVGANVSASFVGALERGETDIAIGRLERIAAYLKEDLRSILGYSRDEVRFNYVPAEDWVRKDVGPGIDYLECLVPGTSQRLTRLTLEPDARHSGPEVDDGMVTVYVVEGDVQVAVDDRLFTLHVGDSGAFAAGNAHVFVNRSDAPATTLINTVVAVRADS